MPGLSSLGSVVATRHRTIIAIVVLLGIIQTAQAFWLALAVPRFAATFAARETAQKLAYHAVGATLTYLVIDSAVQAYYRVNQSANDDLPAGWADRNTPPPEVSAVEKIGNATLGGQTLRDIQYSTPEAARDSWISWRNDSITDGRIWRASDTVGCTFVSGNKTTCGVEQYNTSLSTWTPYTLEIFEISSTTTGCPDGYQQTGDICYLIAGQESVVRYPSDGACEWILDGGIDYIPNPRDTDCDGVAAPTSSTSSIAVTDAQGRVTSETRITANTDGTRTITQSEYDYAAGTTTTTTAIVDDAGTIQQILTSTTDGVADAPQQSVVVNFPTDYARQGTLESIDSKLAPPPPLTGTAAPDLYTPTTLTFDSVLADFRTRAENTAIYTAVSSFFATDVQGQCPQWEIPPVMDMPAIPITAQCSSVMETIWPFISAVIIATAGFVAFRWAFL